MSRSYVGLLLVALGLWCAPAFAQFDALPGLGGGNGAPPSPISAKAVIVPAGEGQPVRLAVTADIQPGWNTYSITQPPGGQVRTKLKVDASPQYKVGEFRSVEAPEIHITPEFNNLAAEEHRGSVTWFAPLELAAGVDPATLEIKGSVFAQACNQVCLPPKDHPFAARLGAAPVKLPPVTVAAVTVTAPTSAAPPAPAPAAVSSPFPGSPPPPPPVALGLPKVEGVGAYVPKFSHLKWTGKLESAAVAPGGKARLLFTADIEPTWHVYVVDAPQAVGNQPTLFAVTDAPGVKIGPPTADRAPTPPHGAPASLDSKLLSYFEKQVTWSLDVDVPADARVGDTIQLAGVLGFQTCDEGSQCDRPQAIRFDAPLMVAAPGASSTSQPIRFFDPQAYSVAAKLVRGEAVGASPLNAVVTPPVSTTGYDIGQIQVHSQDAASSLPVMLLLGALAGFILNFMPCVLPVIGLKVLSFVEQGGHNPRRVLMLNVWYSLGIVSVFLVLATIPVVLRMFYGTQFGWGQQFSYDGFNITLAAVVFTMALSFLGVWEIPIPGFAGSKGANDLASKEGVLGAFTKGVLTTVLATPCSGPFLGTAVAFALAANTAVTYAMFAAMGLGMASPYLLIGIRPSLIKFLPKPGEWMDTFKQVMGFVLVGTVIWLLVPVDKAKLLPALVLLAGLSAACWWIGRTPGYAELPQKLKAWGQAGVFAAIIGWLAFAMPQVTDPLPWKHFTMSEFVKEVDSGKTVMVEFTAKWCATCKALKAANLDRSKTKERIAKNGVVVYEVDIDELPDDGRAFFEKMQPSGGVPLIAIFPAGKKYEPIRFGDGYTQSQILAALDEAGPSKAVQNVAAADGVKLGMQ